MAISITAPTYTVSDGGNTMKVTGFDLQTTGNGPAITVTAFITVINVGATLSVGGSQASGVYKGTYTMNANFL